MYSMLQIFHQYFCCFVFLCFLFVCMLVCLFVVFLFFFLYVLSLAVAIDLIVHHIGEILKPGSSANNTGLAYSNSNSSNHSNNSNNNNNTVTTI